MCRTGARGPRSRDPEVAGGSGREAVRVGRPERAEQPPRGVVRLDRVRRHDPDRVRLHPRRHPSGCSPPTSSARHRWTRTSGSRSFTLSATYTLPTESIAISSGFLNCPFPSSCTRPSCRGRRRRCRSRRSRSPVTVRGAVLMTKMSPLGHRDRGGVHDVAGAAPYPARTSRKVPFASYFTIRSFDEVPRGRRRRRRRRRRPRRPRARRAVAARPCARRSKAGSRARVARRNPHDGRAHHDQRERSPTSVPEQAEGGCSSHRWGGVSGMPLTPPGRGPAPADPGGRALTP